MHISAKSAQVIVNEIKQIIHQHVNLMDSQGYIIASTNPERIGNFHEGAKRIIDEHLEELYITPEMETTTTRAGLNLPILHNGKIIGVVGITGEYEQVYNYSQIVKKMTEILFLERYIQEQYNLNKKMTNQFLEDWIFGDGIEQGQFFIERGIRLHIDILRPRRVMILRLNHFADLACTVQGQNSIENVKYFIQSTISSEPDNVIFHLADKQICFVTPRSDEKMFTLAQYLLEHTKTKYHVDLLIGIDNFCNGTTDVKSAYGKADKASRACNITSGSITFYNQLNIELLLDDIPRLVKEEYITQIFSSCSYDEIEQWNNILEAYFSADGSITVTAEKLFMHKNTLQYKLKKLEEITGYDVRRPSHTAVFYISLLFFRDLSKS